MNINMKSTDDKAYKVRKETLIILCNIQLKRALDTFRIIGKFISLIQNIVFHIGLTFEPLQSSQNFITSINN